MYNQSIMKNTYTTKQIIIVALIVIVIGAVVLNLNSKPAPDELPAFNLTDNNITINNESEKLFVEKYITDNIVTIATDKAVLGGTWYAVSVIADPVTHTGEAIYEDGHIQSKANFTYSYQTNPQSITVTKWEVIQ